MSATTLAQEVLDPALEPPSLGTKLLSGASILGIRQFTVQLLGAATGIILARALSPLEFGIYAVSSFFFYLFLAVGDLGLGASLIRDETEPPMRSLQLAFTVRQILDLFIFAAIWIAAPKLAALYELNPEHAALFRLVAAAAFLHSFQIVPSVCLERALDFRKLAIIEITQAAIYSAVILTLSLTGFGMISFGWAWLSFSLTGAALSYLISPWPIRWAMDTNEIRARLPFALPYQAIGMVQLARDSINPLLVGILLGAGEAGYINFAQMMATISVLAAMVLQRVYLPVFAKLQNDREALGQLFEKLLRTINALNMCCAVLLLALARPITVLVFGDKWLPALPLFYIFWLANLSGPSISAALSLFNALGKSKRSLGFTALTAVGAWLLALPLVAIWGTLGVAISFALVQLASLTFVRAVKKEAPFSFIASLKPWWPAVPLTTVVLLAADTVFPAQSFLALAAYALLGTALYAAIALRRNA